MKKCLICNKEFKPKSNTLGKYCSVKCAGIAHRGNKYGFQKDHMPWNKGLHINTGGYAFPKGHTPWNKGKKLTKEHKEKLSQAKLKNPTKYWLGKEREDMLGDKHWSWKGGITPINHKIRTSAKGLKWIKDIKERDNYECQICGGKEHLRANHIKRFVDYPDLRLKLTNGITICESCDLSLVIKREEEWESYFNFNLMARGYLNAK